MKKNYFKYKKMLKKKGSLRADSASTSKKNKRIKPAEQRKQLKNRVMFCQ